MISQELSLVWTEIFLWRWMKCSVPSISCGLPILQLMKLKLACPDTSHVAQTQLVDCFMYLSLVKLLVPQWLRPVPNLILADLKGCRTTPKEFLEKCRKCTISGKKHKWRECLNDSFSNSTTPLHGRHHIYIYNILFSQSSRGVERHPNNFWAHANF